MKKNKWKTAFSISLAAFALLGIFTIYQTSRVNDYKDHIENSYDRAFYEMVDYVNNIDMLLVKSMVTSTTEKTANFLEEVWRNAALAQTNLSELPVSNEVTEKLSKFFVQVGDYAYVMSVKSAGGEKLTEEQVETLNNMNKYASELNKSLSIVWEDINEGNLTWTSIREAGDEVEDISVGGIIKTFTDYPSLIYDGPFSDHIPETEAKGLTGENITKEEAENKVKDFYSDSKIKSIEYIQATENSKVNVYSFRVSFNDSDNDAYIDITQKGGHVFWALQNRDIGVCKLSVDEAIKKGSEFLEKKGFKNMKDSYYTNESGIATINYVYYENDTKYYPDMIKVKVALDNGEIVGMETKGYIYSHIDREKPKAEVSLADARSLINSDFEVKSTGLAVIPTEFSTEVLVYEFIGKMGDKDMLVYINAQTGKEEDVLIILDTDKGILAQ